MLGQEKLQSQGFENVTDLLTAQPQFAASFGTSRTQSTFSGAVDSGLNLVNLRNLGAFRTLTLINGRRVPSGTIVTESVDFNMIPSANIARVEISTGGQSAVYGADAVAGVVNVITDDRFEGIEFGASYGAALDNKDNINPNAYLRLGNRFDKGHANLTLQYDYQGLVSCKDRYLCAEDVFWSPPGAMIRGAAARSGVSVGGRFFAGNSSYTLVNNQVVPFDVAQHGYNRNAQRTLAIPTKRFLAAANASYEVFENSKAFLELNYSSTDTKAPFEAHPFQSNNDRVSGLLEPSIPVSNPFLPTALRDLATSAGATEITWWQRFSGLEARGATNSRATFRFVAGLQGKFDSLMGFGSNWNYELSYTNGVTRLDSVTNGLISRAALYNGLRVEQDPTKPAGNFRCIDPVARAQGCVPINVFDGYSKEEQKYLLVSAGTRGESKLEDALATLSGSLFELPAGPVNAVIGLESRRVTGFLDYANDINQGITTGNQIGDKERTTFLTNEIFTELSVPVLKDVAFAKELNLEGAFRRSDSARFGEYDTWKIGGDWSPVAGLRFRATKAKAVRTPNLDEVTGISQTFGVVNDPCVNYGTSSNATLKANCAAAGIPANYSPPQVVQQSVSGLEGGNANLKPEEAETLTLGVVFNGAQFEAAPSWLAPLTVTLDRFKIDTTNLISTIGRQEIANLCYTTAGAGRDFYCSKLQRGANVVVPGANYVLNAVNDQEQNIASLEVAGYDFEASYSAPVADIIPGADLGRLSVTTTWTFYDKASRVPLPGGRTIDMLGAAGGSTTDQGWIKRQGTTSFNWSVDKVKVNWTTRFIGEAKSSPTAANAVNIKAHVYHDMQLRYRFGEQLEVYGGVSNVFDKQPPFFPFGHSGTQALDTVPAYYDVFGRSAYVGFKSRF